MAQATPPNPPPSEPNRPLSPDLVPLSYAQPIPNEEMVEEYTGPVVQPGILDYASPRSFSKLRLASRSVISWETGLARRNGISDITITERLEGRSRAVAALIFGGAVVLVLTAHMILADVLFRSRNNIRTTPVLAPVAAIVLTVMFLVIRETWRTTILETIEGELRLAFKAALTSPQTYTWNPGEIVEVRLFETDPANYLGELQILPKQNEVVRLFIDHHVDQLKQMETALRKALEMPPVE